MCTICKKTDLVSLYDGQAEKYSRLRKKKKSYDHAWRRALIGQATGQVLELSVGAGANFKFYGPYVSVTAVDVSAAMIEKAKEAASESGVKAHFITSRVEDLHFEEGRFDTIVSTLSLCAYDDPVAVLKQLQQWCRPGGKLLFLEHGLARPIMIRWLQHRLDGFQYRKIGCHANRDIKKIILEAGLLVKTVERKMLGMIYIVTCSPQSLH